MHYPDNALYNLWVFEGLLLSVRSNEMIFKNLFFTQYVRIFHTNSILVFMRGEICLTQSSRCLNQITDRGSHLKNAGKISSIQLSIIPLFSRCTYPRSVILYLNHCCASLHSALCCFSVAVHYVQCIVKFSSKTEIFVSTLSWLLTDLNLTEHVI